MPTFKQYSFKDSTQVLIWQITETTDWLQNNLIANPTEWEEYERISHPQKQKEWLCGRMALQTLVEQQKMVYGGTFKDEAGKPHLIDNQGYISITNTSEYVAAVFDLHKPVGIDMEKVSDKLGRIVHKFLSEKELEYTETDIKKLAFYWCAKEAIYKLYGHKKVSFKDHIYVEPRQQKIGELYFNEITESYQLFQFRVNAFLGVVGIKG